MTVKYCIISYILRSCQYNQNSIKARTWTASTSGHCPTPTGTGPNSDPLGIAGCHTLSGAQDGVMLGFPPHHARSLSLGMSALCLQSLLIGLCCENRVYLSTLLLMDISVSPLGLWKSCHEHSPSCVFVNYIHILSNVWMCKFWFWSHCLFHCSVLFCFVLFFKSPTWCYLLELYNNSFPAVSLPLASSSRFYCLVLTLCISFTF